MNDDQMDELLATGARDYNQPGAVPREEMWTRIEASRRSRRVHPEARTSRPIWIWSGVGIAAAIILSVGIGIGRKVERATPSAGASVAVRPVAAPPKQDSTKSPGAERPMTTVATPDSLMQQLREQTKNTDRRARELAASEPRAQDEQQPAVPNLAYHLVVLQHLVGSEAMITAFRTAAHRGEMDAQLASWSRELLSTTRLLEASAATQDPTMKRLLEDLDLVIAQIVQYVTHGTNNSEDLDLIEQSITTRGVITKLRGTVSARNSAAGT
jgi:hypothetical protein